MQPVTQTAGSDPSVAAASPDEWVDQHGNYLYRFALSRVKDPGTAEDLVQDAFLAGLRAWDTFEGRSSVRSWLISILKNKIIDHFRKRFREVPSEDIETAAFKEDDLFNGIGRWKTRLQPWQENPIHIYEQKEFFNILKDCLSGMTPRLATAFTLREIEGLSTSEIREIMNISENNAWVILYRARMSLRSCLENRWLGQASEVTT